LHGISFFSRLVRGVSYCCTSVFPLFVFFRFHIPQLTSPARLFHAVCVPDMCLSLCLLLQFFFAAPCRSFMTSTKKLFKHKKHVETYTHTHRQTDRHKTVAKRFDGRSRFDKKGANLTCHFLITHVPNDFQIPFLISHEYFAQSRDYSRKCLNNKSTRNNHKFILIGLLVFLVIELINSRIDDNVQPYDRLSYIFSDVTWQTSQRFLRRLILSLALYVMDRYLNHLHAEENIHDNETNNNLY
jgi:hypothetical protein